MSEEEALTEEEAMAAAMEAMDAAGDDDMAAAMGEDETLSQAEIDNLLGFDSDSNQGSGTGIQALLDGSIENYERLPMLEVVFDRFARALSTSLRNFTAENVEINIDSIISMRFEDYLNSVPLPALLAIFQAVEWENFGLMTIDSSLTYSMVDILLGGARTHRPIRVEGRPFTTIEQDIVKSLTRIMLEEMSVAFNPLTPATFRLERLETNPRFATIARPANPVILISLRVDIEERGGKAEILLPYATLEPVKELLTQMFTGESFGGGQESWELYLDNEIRQMPINLEAVLQEKRLTLGELDALKVGSTIMMNESPGDRIDIRCRGIKLLSGILGEANGKLALRVEKVFTNNMEELS